MIWREVLTMSWTRNVCLSSSIERGIRAPHFETLPLVGLYPLRLSPILLQLSPLLLLSARLTWIPVNPGNVGTTDLALRKLACQPSTAPRALKAGWRWFLALRCRGMLLLQQFFCCFIRFSISWRCRISRNLLRPENRSGQTTYYPYISSAGTILTDRHFNPQRASRILPESGIVKDFVTVLETFFPLFLPSPAHLSSCLRITLGWPGKPLGTSC